MCKVILSRKGFDSNAGGRPSPVLPIVGSGNYLMLSLPIPIKGDPDYYCNLPIIRATHSIGDLIASLRINPQCNECHVDPDIYDFMKPRSSGWRGVLGHSAPISTYLNKAGVKKDDIFLFFGFFNITPANIIPSKIYFGGQTYSRGRPNIKTHALFGYLEVDDKLDISSSSKLSDAIKKYSWLSYTGTTPHPHIYNGYLVANNILYIAKQYSSFNQKLPGWGYFKYDSKIVLTANGYTRSRWDKWFNDLNGRQVNNGQYINPLAGHPNILDTNLRNWQECVIDNPSHAMMNEVIDIINTCTISPRTNPLI